MIAEAYTRTEALLRENKDKLRIVSTRTLTHTLGWTDEGKSRSV